MDLFVGNFHEWELVPIWWESSGYNDGFVNIYGNWLLLHGYKWIVYYVVSGYNWYKSIRLLMWAINHPFGNGKHSTYIWLLIYYQWTLVEINGCYSGYEWEINGLTTHIITINKSTGDINGH